MPTTIPTDARMRVVHATPEQWAVLQALFPPRGGGPDAELVLVVRDETGKSEMGTRDERLRTPPRDAIAMERETTPAVTEEVARSAFAFLVRLDVEGKFKFPAPLTVFRLYCVDGYSADQVARKCRCGKATVIRRLRFIEQQTQTRPEDFRAVSGKLQQIDDEFRKSGAREIYRRGLAQENEEE